MDKLIVTLDDITEQQKEDIAALTVVKFNEEPYSLPSTAETEYGYLMRHAVNLGFVCVMEYSGVQLKGYSWGHDLVDASGEPCYADIMPFERMVEEAKEKGIDPQDIHVGMATAVLIGGAGLGTQLIKDRIKASGKGHVVFRTKSKAIPNIYNGLFGSSRHHFPDNDPYPGSRVYFHRVNK